MESKSGFSFRPRLFECLADYSWNKFIADLNSGFVVGIVALSLCIGLGVASLGEVSSTAPAAGLYTGIIGGFIVSALGGSRVQIGGPAGAFVGLVATTAATYGVADLLVCTALAGAMLFAMGALRLGSLIKFIPHPLTMGFTCGIAIVIIVSQIKPFLGLTLEHDSPHVPEKVLALIRALGTLHWPTLALGVVSLLVLRFWPARWARFVPGSIVVVGLGVVLTWLANVQVATIGSTFGGIPRGLPEFHLPELDLEHLRNLIGPAFAIAALGGIESLLSAVVADGMADDRHDSNQELMAQGAANMISPLFGGIPVTGVIARTATNIRSGGVTPVAGIVHAGVLLLFVLVAAPVASYIPLASLAAVLLLVAGRMGDWHGFLALRRHPPGDALVFLTAFILTVAVDLTWAVIIGILLSAFLFIHRVTETTQVAALNGEGSQGHEHLPPLPPGVLVYRVFGSLLFGAAEKLEYVLQRTRRDTRVVVLHVAAVTAMDATALHRLEGLLERLRRHGRHLILSGPHTQPYAMMENAGFFDTLGRDNVVPDLEAAAARAQVLLTEPRPEPVAHSS